MYMVGGHVFFVVVEWTISYLFLPRLFRPPHTIFPQLWDPYEARGKLRQGSSSLSESEGQVEGTLHDGSRRVRRGTQVTSASARGQCPSTHHRLFFHCSTNWEKGFLELPEIRLLRFPGLTWSRWTAITEEKIVFVAMSVWRSVLMRPPSWVFWLGHQIKFGWALYLSACLSRSLNCQIFSHCNLPWREKYMTA